MNPWKDRREIGDAVLYLGDCLEILPTLGPVDAVATDPQYGLGDKWTGGTWFQRGVYEDDNVEWDKEPSDISQLLALGVPSVIWGGNYLPVPPSRCWLAWVKRDNMPTMADFELAWTNLDRPAKEFYAARSGWRRQHPTEKPLPLIEWSLGFLPSGKTLDPFMGSGTTGVACANLGRRFIGIEIEPRYYEIACERIAAAYAQGRLFA